MRDCNSAIVRVVDAARTNAISGVGDGEASGVSIGLAVGVGLTVGAGVGLAVGTTRRSRPVCCCGSAGVAATKRAQSRLRTTKLGKIRARDFVNIIVFVAGPSSVAQP